MTGYRVGPTPPRWDDEATEASARADGLRLALWILAGVLVTAVVLAVMVRGFVVVLVGLVVVLAAYLAAFGRRR